MDLFDLQAKITLDTSEYEQGLNNAEEKANSSAGSIASKFGGGLKKAGAVAAAGIGVVSAAATVVTKKFWDGINATAEYGDNVDKMSQKIGISAESYQKWDYVMQRAGTSVDNLKMGMKTLSKQAEANSESFQKLGISQEEVKKLSQEELFEKTIKGLSDMEAGTERTTLATELLGKAGADLGPLLNGGSKAIEEQMEIAEKYGMVMSDKAVKASADFEDSLTTLSMTAKGLKNRLMGEFLPAVTEVTDGLGKIFAGDYSGADDIVKGIDDLVTKVTDSLPVIFDIGVKILEGIATSLIGSLPKLMPAVTSVLLSLTQFFVDNLPMFVETGLDLIIALADGISQNLETLIPALIEAVSLIVVTLMQHTPELIKVAWELVKAIAKGILSGFAPLGQAVGDIAKRVIQKFKDIKWLDVGLNIIKGIAKGLKNGAKFIVEAAKNAAGKALKAIKKLLGIASPSKVFELQVGKNMALGVGKGFTEYMPYDEIEEAMNFDYNVPQYETSYEVSTTDEGNEPQFDNRLYSLMSDFFPVLLEAIEEQKEVVIDGRQVINYVDTELGKKAVQKGRGN